MLSDQILELFRGRENVVAVDNGDHLGPVHDTSLAKEHIDAHLAGKACYGIYLVRNDNTVLCSCVDLDNKADHPDPEWKSKAQRVSQRLTELDIPNLIEISQSGEAAHNWIFFDEPVPAGTVRAFWHGLGEQIGVSFKEIYPRQDRVAPGKLGNLIRLPLWNKSHFVSVDWETVEPETALRISKVTADQLKVPEPVRPVESVSTSGYRLSNRVQSLIKTRGPVADRWSGNSAGLTDRSNSAMCYSLACLLARRSVPREEVYEACRCWCAIRGCDKGEREEWITQTVDKAFDSMNSNKTQETLSDGELAYQKLTCQDLDSGDFELEYLIEGALVAKQPCIFAGPKKALKTTVLIDLGISLATQTNFLNKLTVHRKSRVAVMTGESGLATIQETARRIASAKKLELGKIDNLIWSPDLPRFGDPAHADALGKFLRDDCIEELIIDPAYLAMPGADAANLFVQGALLREMSQVCEGEGTGMILAHHTRKGQFGKDSTQPLSLGDIAWAGFQEFSRQWILVNRRQEYVQGTGQHRMWLSCGGSAGHSSLWAMNVDEGEYRFGVPRQWKVELLPPSEARNEEQKRNHEETLKSNQEKILEVMRGLDGAATITAIRDAANMNGTTAKKVLRSLVDLGQVTHTKHKARDNRVHDVYQLAA